MHARIQPRYQATPGTRGRHTPSQEQTPRDQVCPPGTENRQDQTPPAQYMLGDIGNKWAVRILLECILVPLSFLPLLDVNGPLTGVQTEQK